MRARALSGTRFRRRPLSEIESGAEAGKCRAEGRWPRSRLIFHDFDFFVTP